MGAASCKRISGEGTEIIALGKKLLSGLTHNAITKMLSGAISTTCT